MSAVDPAEQLKTAKRALAVAVGTHSSTDSSFADEIKAVGDTRSGASEFDQALVMYFNVHQSSIKSLASPTLPLAT